MNKVHIGICDDEKIILNQLGRMIEDILGEEKIEYKISYYTSGEELIQQNMNLDLVFLDIDMPVMDGIETGRRICIMNPDCKIIMATGRTERFKESFKISAFRFVTKPFDKKELEEVLRDYLARNIGLGSICLYHNRIPYEVEQRSIKFIKAYDGYIECKVKDMFFRQEVSLSSIELELDYRIFAAVSRKYLVNMLWIQEYKGEKIRIDDFEIQVSRRKKKEFEKKWIYFDLNYR